MIKKIIKILVWVVLIALVFCTFYLYGKIPNRSGEIRLQGIKQPVDVWFDEWAIPHIDAKNLDDLYFSLGYLHAQDRLFQMEILRRLSQGQLSEILGTELVDVDKLFRRLSIHHFSKKWQKKLRDESSTEMMSAIDSYLSGLNEFASNNRPIEFDVLRIPAHRYQLEDILSISGYMSWSFGQALKEDPVVEFVAQNLGQTYLDDLATHSNSTTRTIPVNQLESIAKIARLPGGIAPFVGSNSWVLSGDKTESGSAMLVNDPHMGFAQPSVWYEAHLKSPDFELYGHHLAMVPFALLGHNRDVAWGLTMFENDSMDLYQELRNPDNINQYWANDRWVDFEIRKEKITVKGAEPLTFDVRTSRHGPIINESFDAISNTQNQPIALWWQFLQPGNKLLNAFWQLPKAKTISQAYDAVENIHSPGLNVMYANASGDIAWFAAARLPVRPDGTNSKRILDGASGKEDIMGYLDFSKNPMSINPGEGYVYSANNQPAGNDSGVVPGYYAPRDRADRINFWMVGSAKHNSDSMKLMLMDSKSQTAQLLITLLNEALGDSFENVNEQAKRLALRLYNWDTGHRPDSIEPTLYNRFRANLQKNLFADELTETLYAGFEDSFLLDRSLWSVLSNKSSVWWDNKNTIENEGWTEVVQLSWQQSVNGLESDLGVDFETWYWSRASVLTHKHALGQVEPLDKIFNVGPFESNGGIEVLNNLSVSYDKFPYEVAHGPSTRRIIDLSDPENTLGINPTGQSGVVVDRHYGDQAAMFAAGEFREQQLNFDQIKASAMSHLQLMPSP